MNADLPGLVADILALSVADGSFAETARRIADRLRRDPAVRSAQVTERLPGVAHPGSPDHHEVRDPLGPGLLTVEVDPNADPVDLARLDTVLSVTEAVCLGRTVPTPRAGDGEPDVDTVVITIDELGNQYTAPGAMERVLGRPTPAAGPPDMRELIHPDDLTRVQQAYRRAVERANSSVEVDVRVRHADGHWVLMTAEMLNLTAVPTVGAVVVRGRDVTDLRGAQRWARAERVRLRAVLRMLAGAVVVDDGERVILANASVRDLLGVEAHPDVPVREFLDRLVERVAEPADLRGRLDRARGSGTEHRAIRMVLGVGRVLAGDVVPLVDESTGRMGTLWYFQDTTEEALARSELEEHNRTLAAAAEVKSRFVATVSHELRTPLTAILAFGGLLVDTRRTLTPDQVEALDVINRNATRLLHLVDDLLLLSRLETNQLPLDRSPIDLADLVRGVCTDHTVTAAERGVPLLVDVEPGPTLLADPMRITQVLDNLVGNAVKFTPAGGRVRVGARPDDGGWTVTVTDSGIGIPAADVPRIFDPFARATNATGTALPGSGLGLSICAQIVDQHGGRITVDSTEGAGTAVRVHLPGGAR